MVVVALLVGEIRMDRGDDDRSPTIAEHVSCCTGHTDCRLSAVGKYNLDGQDGGALYAGQARKFVNFHSYVGHSVTRIQICIYISSRETCHLGESHRVHGKIQLPNVNFKQQIGRRPWVKGLATGAEISRSAAMAWKSPLIISGFSHFIAVLIITISTSSAIFMVRSPDRVI
nr:hypothetical protein Iba_chr01cCG4180 [Ipomoea batatas]